MDRKYLRTVAISVLTVLLCVGVIAYLGYHLFSSDKDAVEVLAAESVTAELKSEYTGYIMRSEQLLYAPTAGGISYRCANGEKVSRDSVVAHLYDGANGAEVREQLMEYDQKISILSHSSIDEGTRLGGTAYIDGQIKELYRTIMRKTEEGDIDYALQKKNELNILLNRRKVLVGTVENFTEQSERYVRSEEDLIAGLGSAHVEITAASSGYFFTDVDGYETVFDPSLVADMTIDDFDRMIAADPVTESEGGYTIGKLVTDFKWYLLFEIAVEDTKNYTIGSTYEVVFPYNADTHISMSLERMITPTEGGRCVLVLSASEMPGDFNYLRSQTVQIVERSYSGYRVPTSAVRVVDGVRGVYVLEGSTVRFRRITPLTELDGYMIVQKQNTLDEDSVKYDLGYCELVITNGKDLYEGKIIE